MKVCIALLAVLLMSAASLDETRAQTEGTINLSISARDDYTESPLDSVFILFYHQDELIDSTMTDESGKASLLITVTRVGHRDDIPATFNLSYNYPNPFNNDTRINVENPVTQSMRVEVFNILGQRVAAEDVFLDAGNFVLNVSLSHVATGVYFLRLQGSESKVVRMVKVGRGTHFASQVFRFDSQSGIRGGVLSKHTIDADYLLRAERFRYSHLELPLALIADTTLHLELMRNNIVGFAVHDADTVFLNRQLEIKRENENTVITTPDTVVLRSGIYSVISKDEHDFHIDNHIEIPSIDTSFIFHPPVSLEAVVSGIVANDLEEFVSNATVRIFKNGSLYNEVMTNGEGFYQSAIIADGSLYSFVAMPQVELLNSFDPLTYTGYSPSLKVLTPRPAGEYTMNFLVRTEMPLSIPGAAPDTLIANYTISTPGGTVSIANIPPGLQIVGGSARAYSPTYIPDAFPGEFATRQEGFESGLISGGFVSVNLLQSDGNGLIQPVSELVDEFGAPVEVELRFRIDRADWHIIQDPAHFNQLPGYTNLPDRIEVPLYYYDEELGDWILTGEFGWLENEMGYIHPNELSSIQDGTYQLNVYVVGRVTHFSFINYDYPTSAACFVGRLRDQNGNPVPNANLTFDSMPGSLNNTFFSNVITATTDENGFFQIRVPRTETGPSDDWNNNNRIDHYHVAGRYEDKDACALTVFNNNGQGYRTPDFPEDAGCINLGNLTVQLREAKKVDFEITFLDIERDTLPDYPLFVEPPATSGANYAVATLVDIRVPLMGDIWQCTCNSGSGVSDCNSQTTPNSSGVAHFTLPVLESDDSAPIDITEVLYGTFLYRKMRPDFGFGAYEFAECNYFVPEDKKKETVRCKVERRGPPVITILQPEPSRIDTLLDSAGADSVVIEYKYLYDDELTFEASGIDLDGNTFDFSDSFFWTDLEFTRVIRQGRTFTAKAASILGTGTELGIRANGIDFYGWTGYAEFTEYEVSEVSVEISPNSVALVPGDTITLSVSVTGANDTTVQWTTEDPNIAVVNNDGLVTATGPGEVSIIARSVADPSKTAEAVINIENLIASFTVSPPAGEADTDFTFDASDSEGDIVNYDWDFGDGTTANDIIVFHTYGIASEFTVTLTITSSTGATASTDRIVSTTGLPVVLITATPLAGNPPLEVSFDGSDSFSPKGDIVKWDWEFGDGNTDEGETAIHTYEQSGLYIVKLIVEDVIGQTASDSIEIRVNMPPVALFTVAPESGDAPLDITVNAINSFDPDGFIVSYDWDFGDGTVIENGDVVEEHTYTDTGDYTITLTVTDNDGATADVSTNIFVGCSNILTGDIFVSNSESLQQLIGVCGIDGNLTIWSSEFNNLSGLTSLRFIEGNLNILSNEDLNSLNGLNNLTKVSGLVINNNASLTDLQALSNLHIIDEIRISSNPNLISIDIFNEVESLHSLFIQSNLSLSMFNGFAQLKRIDDFLTITGTNISVCELIAFRERIIHDEGIGGTTTLTGNQDTFNGNLSINTETDIQALDGICMVNGQILISNSQLTSLAGLDSLKIITGNFRIENNALLLDLTGLENLIEVGGDLSITFNQSIESLTGLDRLRYIRGTHMISWNQALQSFTGIDNLTTIDKSFYVQSMPLIENFEGFNKLKNIGETFSISSLTGLTSFTGLESLEYIGERLQIISVGNIQNFHPLSNLHTIRRGLHFSNISGVTDLSGFENANMNFSNSNITIESLPDLQDLTGLDNVTDINQISLNHNPSLSSLSGLENLTRIRGGGLRLSNLPELTDISALSSLNRIDGMLTIINTGSITDFMPLINLQQIRGGLYLDNVPGLVNLGGLHNVNIEYPESELIILNMPDLEDLSGLNGTTFLYYVYLSHNQALSTLIGLEDLKSVPHGVYLGYNPNLSTLNSLSRLEEIDDGGLSVIENIDLTSLEGLQNLTTVKGSLFISNMDGLTDLTGLSGLAEINGLNIQNNANLTSLTGLGELLKEDFWLSINNNESLADLSGLQHVEKLSSININQNQSLTSLDGLNNLNHITGDISISNNPMLHDISAFQNTGSIENLYLFNNGALESLNGFESLTTMRSLRIINNAQLNNIESLNNLSGELTRLEIDNNPSLTSLNGLENITKINGVTRIISNASLTNMSGLDGIVEISSSLDIRTNAALTNLNGLHNLERVQFGNLSIVSNPQLESVTEMTALSRIGFNFTVQSNSSLPTCDAENLRDQVLEREGIGGSVTISGNDDSGVCEEELSLTD